MVTLVALLSLSLTGCTSKQTQSLVQPSQALGTVLAEETIRAAGPKKQIAIISPDANWGPASEAEDSFKSALKKQGYSAVAAKSANLGDPMQSGPVGLKSADFFEVLEKFPDAGAIVSFGGLPLWKPGDATRLLPDHPPVLVVATAMLGKVPGVPTDRMQLASSLDTKTIQLAIIDGAEPDARMAGKTDASHELFSQNYRILRRPE